MTNLEKTLIKSTNNRVESFLAKMDRTFSNTDIAQNAPKKPATEIVGSTVLGFGKSLFGKLTGKTDTDMSEVFQSTVQDIQKSTSSNNDNIVDCAKVFLKTEIAHIKTDVSKASKHIDGNIQEISTKAKQVVKELNTVMKDQLSFKLSLPDVKTLNVGSVGIDISTEGHMKMVNHTRKVENDSIFGGMQRWIGDIMNTDWGYDNEIYQLQELNKQQFFKDFKHKLYEALNRVLQDFTYVANRNMERLEEYHKTLNEDLIRIKEELQQIVQEKENNSQAMEQKIIRIQELLSEIGGIQDLIKAITLKKAR